MARTSKYITTAEALHSAAMWRAGLYLRLSKEDGDIEEGNKFESDSISNQRLIIEDFLAENPDIQVEDIYPDDGYTGTNFDRPNFLRLIEDIRIGRIHCVIVKDLSRFGRNYLEAGQYLEIFFPVMKIRFISVVDDIDSHLYPSSMSNISVSFKNVMNEEYCRDISNKIKSVFVAKRESGEYLGSGFAPYGYKKNPENTKKLIIDDEAAETVRLIFKMFLEGNSVRRITNRLNEIGMPNPSRYKKEKLPSFKISKNKINDGLWSNTSVKNILLNRIYTGDMVQGKYEKISHKIDKIREVQEDKWVVVENTHESIIDRTAFNNIQEILKRDTRISHISKEIGLFSGFLKCADCGRLLGKKKASREKARAIYHYYTCRTYEIMKKEACTRHTTRSDNLENAVFTVISKFVEMAVKMDNFIETINKSPMKNATTIGIQNALKAREKEKIRIEGALIDLYPDWKNELITKEQYLVLKTKYEAEFDKVKNILAGLRKTFEREIAGVDGTNDFIQNFKKYKNLSKLTREVLIALVDNIIVHEGGGIEINFKFQDAFERAAEYIETNRNLLTDKAAEFVTGVGINNNMYGVAL